jgi:chromosome segregation ATPase
MCIRQKEELQLLSKQRDEFTQQIEQLKSQLNQHTDVIDNDHTIQQHTDELNRMHQLVEDAQTTNEAAEKRAQQLETLVASLREQLQDTESKLQTQSHILPTVSLSSIILF